MQLDLRVLQLHLQVENVGLRGIAIGLRGSQRPLRIGIVQRGQHKSLVYVQSFGKKDARDASGHLGRYGGAPLWRDISAGVEQSLWPGVRSVRRSNLHRRRLMHVRVDAAHDQERDEQNRKNNRDKLSGVSRAALVSLDPQSPEVRLYRCFRHSWPIGLRQPSGICSAWRQHQDYTGWVYRPAPANRRDCRFLQILRSSAMGTTCDCRRRRHVCTPDKVTISRSGSSDPSSGHGYRLSPIRLGTQRRALIIAIFPGKTSRLVHRLTQSTERGGSSSPPGTRGPSCSSSCRHRSVHILHEDCPAALRSHQRHHGNFVRLSVLSAASAIASADCALISRVRSNPNSAPRASRASTTPSESSVIWSPGSS